MRTDHSTVMLLLFEGGSDCIGCVATHLEKDNGSYKSAGEAQSTKPKMYLQEVLRLQEQDTKPIPQNLFITDLLTFDLYADLPEIIVRIILIVRMKASQHYSKFVICSLNSQG